MYMLRLLIASYSFVIIFVVSVVTTRPYHPTQSFRQTLTKNCEWHTLYLDDWWQLSMGYRVQVSM